MAKLVRVAHTVEVPLDLKENFYQEFGDVMKSMLLIKEPSTFVAVVSAFMEFAKNTELEDLTFMIPEGDKVVE